MSITATPSGIYVYVSRAEAATVGVAGIIRQNEYFFSDGQRDAYGCKPEDGYSVTVLGLLGEYVVAKYRQQYWRIDADGPSYSGDVGPDIEVRTRARHDWQLIVHPRDHDERVFVLVTGLPPHFYIRGWIRGRDAKRDDWWLDPSGKNRWAYFVPSEKLRPL